MTERVPHRSVPANAGTRLQLAISPGLAQGDEIFKGKFFLKPNKSNDCPMSLE